MDILYILKGIIIAIVEGLTEFIPVSSTGHLILVGDLLNFGNTPFETTYMVVIQLGAILAIVVLYWKKILAVLSSLLKGEVFGKRFTLAILIGILPAFVFGFLLNDFIDEHLFSVPTVTAALIVGALMMLWFEKNYRGRETVHNVEDITPAKALKVGLFQCMSLWPGMSRSASTIMGGWHQGLSPSLAAEYSFFLAIPIMVGASGLKVLKYAKNGGFATITATQSLTFVLGFVVAFVVALLCVKAFMSYIQKKPMKVFAYYRLLIGVVLLISLLFR